MGYNPQESLENTINTMGTLLGVHLNCIFPSMSSHNIFSLQASKRPAEHDAHHVYHILSNITRHITCHIHLRQTERQKYTYNNKLVIFVCMHVYVCSNVIYTNAFICYDILELQPYTKTHRYTPDLTKHKMYGFSSLKMHPDPRNLWVVQTAAIHCKVLTLVSLSTDLNGGQ